MGFYAPAEIVRCARAHGVTVLAPDACFSDWDNTLERMPAGDLALRLGFRQLDGFREEDGHTIMAERGYGYPDFADFARRTALPHRALVLLAEADAFRGFGAGPARGAVGGAPPARRFAPASVRAAQHPGTGRGNHRAFARDAAQRACAGRLPDHAAVAERLPHPVPARGPGCRRHHRLRRLAKRDDGAFVRCAGIVLVRQRPGEGNAVSSPSATRPGVCNVVVWARTFEQFRKEVMGSRLLLAEGRVQKSPEGVIHLMATNLIDRSADLKLLSGEILPRHPPTHRHPRNVRVFAAVARFSLEIARLFVSGARPRPGARFSLTRRILWPSIGP